MNTVKKTRRKFMIIQLLIFLTIISTYIILNTKMIKYVPECVFYKKYGLLCPGCGGTRFMISLSNLNFVKAFYIHPVFFMLMSYLLMLDIVYIINVILKKHISIFKWWHIVLWGILLLIYTIFRNIRI